LEEWLIKSYNPKQPELIKQLFKPFRTVRKER
jgi:hypothetical protein